MRRFRVALVGLGEAARRIHVPAYAGLANVEIVGGADPADCHRFAFPLFASTEEMIGKTRPDVLAALTPTDSHNALSRLGLNAGCHVFC